MDDITDRAEDYERRLSQAGSTEAIIKSLVSGAERSRRTVRLLAVSLIADVILSMAAVGLTWVAWNQSEKVERNTNQLRSVIYTQCLESQKSGAGLNAILDALIVSVGTNKQQTPAEKVTRVRNYTRARVTIHSCVVPPLR